MLDFSQIQTPPENGRVLIVPEPDRMVRAMYENAQTLDSAHTELLNTPLSHWRKRTKESLAGSSDTPVIVIGHQPGFMHPGVWAKHIVATRLAQAVGGRAINLIVDHDAPKNTTLVIPTVQNKRLRIHPIRFADVSAGLTYEQFPRLSKKEIDLFEQAIQHAMGDRYDHSQMPIYIQGLKQAHDADDWVDQAVAARRAVEKKFDIVTIDHRVSRVWYSPLLIDIFLHADRFVHSYNRALKWYRKEYRVRGSNRPIPDLKCEHNRCELPVWAHRGQELRRRLFVEKSDSSLRLWADREEIGTIPASGPGANEYLHLISDGFNNWRLRPRALTLTLWARLILADLFIHGIAGAKYDRITDVLISDYYNLQPPHMACVSATMCMNLPTTDTTEETLRKLQHAARDMQHNPQRNLPSNIDLTGLQKQKEEALQHALQLRNHDPSNHFARRKVFQQIRDIHQTMLNACPDAMAALQNDIQRAKEEWQQNTVARDRTYFFGLFDRKSLETLLDTLPLRDDFRV